MASWCPPAGDSSTGAPQLRGAKVPPGYLDDAHGKGIVRNLRDPVVSVENDPGGNPVNKPRLRADGSATRRANFEPIEGIAEQRNTSEARRTAGSRSSS
jgi:hypothetical protein